MRYLLGYLLVCITFLSPSLIDGVEPARFDYILLVDCSGSMIGLGDGRGINIFPDVKDALIRFVDMVEAGSYIVVLPFHQGVVDSFKVRVQYPDDREKLKEYIRSLKATGDYTWLTISFQRALDVAGELGRSPEGQRSVQTIFLYTDGRGNGPGDENMDNMTQALKLRRIDNPYIYARVVTIGRIFKGKEREKLEKGGIQVVENPGRQLRPCYSVEVRPIKVSLENWKGDEREFKLVFNYPKEIEDTILRVKLEVPFLDSLGEAVVLEPTEFPLRREQIFHISLSDGKGLSKWRSTLRISGSMEGYLHFTSPRMILFFTPDKNTIRFTVSAPFCNRVPCKVIFPLGGLFLAGIVGMIILSKVRTAEFPKGAILESTSGISYPLKVSWRLPFGKPHITIGPKGDIRCLLGVGPGTSSEFVKVKPWGNKLMVRRISGTSVKLLDGMGNNVGNISIDSGESFVLEDDDGNREEFTYRVI
jgi:hypothetical protein